jgi:hypothetical protein
MRHEHVGLAVLDGARPGIEQVPARRAGNAEWVLLKSPLYAMAVAAGDTIRLANPESGEFEIVRRGGNVCVQFYLGHTTGDESEQTERVAQLIVRELVPIAGRMDAKTSGLISFTIPVDVGFPTIESVFLSAVERFPGSEWQYSNVYDPETGEPLCWWE